MRPMLKNDKVDRVLRVAAYALLAACAALFLYTVVRYKPKPTVMDILPYPVALVALCWLLCGDYKGRPVYWLGAAFVVWYGVTRLLIRDIYGRQPFYYYAELVMVYLFAFPFARAVGEKTRLRVLDILALVVVVVVTAASMLGLCAMLENRPISMPDGRYTTTMSASRLWILALNPNICSLFMVISMLLTVYLLLRHRKTWAYVAGVLALVIDYLALVATDSRMAKISLLVCVAVMAAMLGSRLWKRRFRGRAAAVGGIAVAAVLVCYFGFSLGVRLLNNGAMAYARREARIAAEAAMSEEITSVEEAAAVEEPTEAATVETEIEETDSETVEAEVLEEIVLDETAASRQLVDEYGSGRVRVYTCFFNYLKDHTSVLLKGANNFSIRMMTCYGLDNDPYYIMIHLHNSFFQTLAATGVPGLLLALAICVYLLVYSLRVLFSRERTAAEKMLPIFLLVLIVDSVAESPLFVPYDEATNSFFNLFFFLCAGYVVELGKKSGHLVKK